MTSKHKELVDELNKHKLEVSKLRNALNELDKEKEQWFSKKEEHSKKIRESIQRIKDSKDKRDSLTKEVKELKAKRESINKEVSAKLDKLYNLRKQKIETVKALNIDKSPSRIKQEIEKLEFKIETEPMSFEKEQSVMRKIKELKKAYADSEEIIEINKRIKELSDEIRRMKKGANEAHRFVQEKATQSQVLHEEILKASAEIDKMKVDGEYAFKKFSEFKKQFTEVNNQLKEKLKTMNNIKEQLDKISMEKQERRKQQEESFLKSKEEEVNAKIRRREKLTTEDLLVFQKIGKE